MGGGGGGVHTGLPQVQIGLVLPGGQYGNAYGEPALATLMSPIVRSMRVKRFNRWLELAGVIDTPKDRAHARAIGGNMRSASFDGSRQVLRMRPHSIEQVFGFDVSSAA